jgi:hypothetical protein
MSVGRRTVTRAKPSATTAGLLLVFAVTAALFVPTVIGYVSFDEVKTAEMTVEDASMAGDRSTLELTVGFSNPTGAAVTVVDAETTARVDGTAVTRIAGVSVERVTVPPGETGTFVMRKSILDGEQERANSGLREDSLAISGKVWVEVRGEKTSVMFR